MTGLKLLRSIVLAALCGLVPAVASAETLAKDLFGSQRLPAATAPKSYGFYSKGCFSGGVAIATDGPTWQAMRLSRNRRWGHPTMVNLIERLSREATADGWPGLLVGDLSQPRGGPMLSGHASHQIGLDADIWLTPMPNRRLSPTERENMSATSMIRKDGLTVDDRIWTPAHARLLKRAASYPEVERILVHRASRRSSATRFAATGPGCARCDPSGATTIISTCVSAASRGRPAARNRIPRRVARAAIRRSPGGSPKSPGARPKARPSRGRATS